MKKINLKKIGFYTFAILLFLAGTISILELTSNYKFSSTINIEAPVISKKSISINAPINEVYSLVCGTQNILATDS